MNFVGFSFILLCHYLSGNGLINIFGIKLSKTVNFALSFICGVMVLSIIPFILQLFYCPITTNTVGISCAAISLLLNIKRLVTRDFPKLKFDTASFFNKPLYEWLFIFFFIILMVPSVWKCFYFPPFARDILSGPEIIAEYTVKEHTMLNSVLSLNLESTNNHLKPPFITDLQIIYKLFVQQFGQLWLSVMFISFLIWLYAFLKEKLHPIIACILLLLFITMADIYAYSYVILFDECNMIMVFASVYFLCQYFEKKENNLLYFSTLMFAFATFIRSETLVLVYMFIPLLLFNLYKSHTSLKKSAIFTTVFIVVPYFFYFIWINVYLKYYMPNSFSVAKEINPHLENIGFIFTRMGDMLTYYLYGGNNINHYSYFINIFTILFLADLIVTRKLNKEARAGVYALAVVFFGLAILGYLLPLFDLENTTKRGIFKLFPLMLLVLRNNTLLQRLSSNITNWEYAKEDKGTILPKTHPIKTASATKNKKR